MYKACVIGCGQIGMGVIKELVKVFGKDNVIGVDKTEDAYDNLTNIGVEYRTPSSMPDAEVYIITLWTMDSIIDTASKLENKNPNLIFLESTIDPNRAIEVKFAFDKHYDKLVYFPHRYNPNDPEHGIYNQIRVLGSDTAETDLDAKAWLVGNGLMNANDVYIVQPDIAIMSKVVENAYRAMEIIMAQELKEFCDYGYLSFEELREACNTKWNIDIREAKDGVKGKCLPKDLAFFNKHYKEGMLFRLGEMLNEQYIRNNSDK